MTEQEQALTEASAAFIKAVKTGLTIGHVARVVTSAAEIMTQQTLDKLAEGLPEKADSKISAVKVVSNSGEVAHFSDGSSAIRQRLGLNSRFGKISTRLIHPSIFKQIFKVGIDIDEAEFRFRNPDDFDDAGDGR